MRSIILLAILNCFFVTPHIHAELIYQIDTDVAIFSNPRGGVNSGAGTSHFETGDPLGRPGWSPTIFDLFQFSGNTVPRGQLSRTFAIANIQIRNGTNAIGTAADGVDMLFLLHISLFDTENPTQTIDFFQTERRYIQIFNTQNFPNDPIRSADVYYVETFERNRDRAAVFENQGGSFNILARLRLVEPPMALTNGGFVPRVELIGFGDPSGGGFLIAVPEPSSIVLVGALLLLPVALFKRRWPRFA